MNRHEIKKKRLEKIYRQVISEAVLYKIGDERIASQTITITRVNINDNLTEAEVFFTFMSEGSNNTNPNKLTKALYQAQSFFLSILKNKIKIKYLPQIKFLYDKEFKSADNLVNLIDKLSQTYRQQNNKKE